MLMQRRTLLFLAVVLCVPAIAHAAITITVGNHILLANTPGQTFDILLSGAGGADEYDSGDIYTTIAAGGPVVTHFDDDTGGSIPASKRVGTIWEGGSGGIFGDPDSTSPTSTGRRTAGSFASADFLNITTNGIYITVTVDTTGIAAGVYAMNLDDHPLGSTILFKGLFEDEELVDVEEITSLVLVNGTLTIVPEPASMMLGLFAVAGLGAVAVRRRRRRRAA